MNQNALYIVQLLFTSVWSLFTSWHIPGTNVTPAEFLMFLVFTFFVIRWFKKLFNDKGSDKE